MTSKNNYRNEYLSKARIKDNKFLKPRKMVTEKDLSEQRRNKYILWITFYRRNIHRFVQNYLQIKLFPFQIIWIYWMGISDSFYAICSRAVGKSWLIGVFAVARSILYPGSLTVIVSSTKEQAGGIISEKIKGLQDTYPNVAREIRNLTSNANKYECEFHNGSIIRVVPSTNSARGKRSNYTIYEEFRLIDKEVLDSVIRPFSSVRQPPYLKLPEYSHLVEEPKEVFISSAYHKGLWWWFDTIKAIKSLLKGENIGFIAIDYLAAIKHNIKTIKVIKRDKDGMDDITFLEEYENIAWGESSDAYFKLSMFMKLRNVKKAFYPQKNDEYNEKKNPFDIPRVDGEIRLVCCDVATRAGRTNDLTIIGCIRLLPTNKGYYREITYIESHSGKNTISQTLRLKQIYHDFNGDYIVLDIANAGITIYDQLGSITKDDERDLEYPALTILKHQAISDDIYNELSVRTLAINADEVIFPISASARLNSEIAVAMRDKLKKRMFGFLVDETKAEDYLFKNRKEIIANDDIGEKAFFMHPYVQTSLLVNECINLSMKIVSGNIKLEEPEGGRKDRYTCISYGSYFAGFLDGDLLRETSDTDQEFLDSVMVY